MSTAIREGDIIQSWCAHHGTCAHRFGWQPMENYGKIKGKWLTCLECEEGDEENLTQTIVAKPPPQVGV